MGIDAGIVESALADLDPEDERVAATDLIAKKLTPSQVDRLQEDPASRDAVFRRLVGMLMRRGYAQSLAIEVVTESLDAVTTSTD
jgi:regulatory protein